MNANLAKVTGLFAARLREIKGSLLLALDVSKRGRAMSWMPAMMPHPRVLSDTYYCRKTEDAGGRRKKPDRSSIYRVFGVHDAHEAAAM